VKHAPRSVRVSAHNARRERMFNQVMASAASARGENTPRPQDRSPRTRAWHARQTRTRLLGVVPSRIVSAMQASQGPSLLETCPRLGHVNNVRMATARIHAARDHTHLQTALGAWIALPTPSPRDPAVRRRTACAIQDTRDPTAACATRAWRASTRTRPARQIAPSARAASTPISSARCLLTYA
jgi:hypothetical protein